MHNVQLKYCSQFSFLFYLYVPFLVALFSIISPDFQSQHLAGDVNPWGVVWLVCWHAGLLYGRKQAPTRVCSVPCCSRIQAYRHLEHGQRYADSEVSYFRELFCVRLFHDKATSSVAQLNDIGHGYESIKKNFRVMILLLQLCSIVFKVSCLKLMPQFVPGWSIERKWLHIWEYRSSSLHQQRHAWNLEPFLLHQT